MVWSIISVSCTASPTFQDHYMSTSCLPRHWLNFPAVKFLSKISRLVFVVLFVIWSEALTGWAVQSSPFQVGHVYFLFARTGGSMSHWHIFSMFFIHVYVIKNFCFDKVNMLKNWPLDSYKNKFLKVNKIKPLLYQETISDQVDIEKFELYVIKFFSSR